MGQISISQKKENEKPKSTMKFSLQVICFLTFVFLSLTDHQQVLAAASRGDEIAANALDLSNDDRQLKKGKRNVKKICKKKCKLSEDKKCVKQCRNEEKKKKKERKKNQKNKKNPKPTDDIPTTAIKAEVFNTLVAALGAADLVGAISEPKGPFTVFAPTDDAFAKLREGLVTCLLKPRNKQFLKDVLLYHVVSARVLSTDLSDGQKILTLVSGGGSVLTVCTMRGHVKINDSKVTKADVLTSNGVIHIIDAVLDLDGKLDGMVCE